MKPSIGFLKVAAWLLVCSALFGVINCKPEGPRVLDQKTGALVPPMATVVPTSISPLPTPSSWPPTSEPAVTATPQSDPLNVYDPVNHFSLRLLPGWRASVGGITVITNYDTETLSDVHDMPFSGMKIQLGVGRLAIGESFQQWQVAQIVRDTSPSPENNWPGQTATEPVPYSLGAYEGFSYFLIGPPRVFVINLPLSDERVASMSLMPADSPALEEALTILSTLDTSPRASPQP